MKKLWTKDFLLFAVVSTMVFMASGMMNSPLPRYAMHIGGDAFTAGLVTGLFALASCICRPIFGRLLDIYGRRMILLLGIAFYSAIAFSYNWAGTVVLLLTLRFLQGAGMSAYSTALGTVASDLLPAERLVEGFGYYSLIQTITGSIGPMLGLGLVAGSEYHYLFGITSAFSIAGLFGAYFLRYESKKKSADPEMTAIEKPQRPQKAGILEKSALPIAVAVFFVSITTGTVMTFLSPYASTLGIESIGAYFTINAAVLFLSRLFLAKLIRWMGTMGVIVAGFAMVGLSMALLCFSKTLCLFLIAAAVNGLGAGVLFPIFNSQVVSICPADRRGAANGTYYIGIDVGIGGGAVLGGIFAQAAGYPALYLLSAACVAIAFLVYWSFARGQVIKHETSVRI